MSWRKCRDTIRKWYRLFGGVMDVPKPMLNSPAEGGTDAANAFFRDVERRVHESREARKAVNQSVTKRR